MGKGCLEYYFVKFVRTKRRGGSKPSSTNHKPNSFEYSPEDNSRGFWKENLLKITGKRQKGPSYTVSPKLLPRLVGCPYLLSLVVRKLGSLVDLPRMTTYEYFNKWDKFDVEKELDKVDEDEVKEDKERSKNSLSKRKENVENGALGTALADAEALEAQARVAALKASKSRRRKKGKGSNSTDIADGVGSEARVRELLERAEVAKKKSSALKAALSTRDTARDFLRGNEASPAKALQCAELALKNVIELEQNFPEFLETNDDIDAMNEVLRRFFLAHCQKP